MVALSNFEQTLFQMVTHRLVNKDQIDGYSESAKSSGLSHCQHGSIKSF